MYDDKDIGQEIKRAEQLKQTLKEYYTFTEKKGDDYQEASIEHMKEELGQLTRKLTIVSASLGLPFKGDNFIDLEFSKKMVSLEKENYRALTDGLLQTGTVVLSKGEDGINSHKEEFGKIEVGNSNKLDNLIEEQIFEVCRRFKLSDTIELYQAVSKGLRQTGEQCANFDKEAQTRFVTTAMDYVGYKLQENRQRHDTIQVGNESNRSGDLSLDDIFGISAKPTLKMEQATSGDLSTTDIFGNSAKPTVRMEQMISGDLSANGIFDDYEPDSYTSSGRSR